MTARPMLVVESRRLEMRKVLLNLPTLGMVVATRAALGAGLGLLLAERIEPRQRRNIGVGLVAVGVLTTFPLARAVLRSIQSIQRSTAD